MGEYIIKQVNIMNKPDDMDQVWASNGSTLDPGAVQYEGGWPFIGPDPNTGVVGPLPPDSEVMNFIQNKITQFCAHINQSGIAVWDSTTEYIDYSWARSPVDGQVYVSLIASNTGNEPSVSSSDWVIFKPEGQEIGDVLQSYESESVMNGRGYLQLLGQAVSRSVYADLFALLGTQYGPGDGSTTFNLPNLAEQSVIFSLVRNDLTAANNPFVTITPNGQMYTMGMYQFCKYNTWVGTNLDSYPRRYDTITSGAGTILERPLNDIYFEFDEVELGVSFTTDSKINLADNSVVFNTERGFGATFDPTSNTWTVFTSDAPTISMLGTDRQTTIFTSGTDAITRCSLGISNTDIGLNLTAYTNNGLNVINTSYPENNLNNCGFTGSQFKTLNTQFGDGYTPVSIHDHMNNETYLFISYTDPQSTGLTAPRPGFIKFSGGQTNTFILSSCAQSNDLLGYLPGYVITDGADIYLQLVKNESSDSIITKIANNQLNYVTTFPPGYYLAGLYEGNFYAFTVSANPGVNTYSLSLYKSSATSKWIKAL